VNILALDSATTTGWADLAGEKLVASGAVNVGDLLRLDAFASYICARRRPDLVVVEDNFVMRGPKANPNTMKILSRIVGAWLLAFTVRGVPTEVILPGVWQNGVLGSLTKLGTKRAAAIWVQATYGITVSEDAADAIGLATWVARRELVAQRMAGVGAIPRAALL
jgi:Holliday junction resolvasome RuvABC endonuclease subunit